MIQDDIQKLCDQIGVFQRRLMRVARCRRPADINFDDPCGFASVRRVDDSRVVDQTASHDDPQRHFVTSALRSLENVGAIVRNPDPRDGRRFFVDMNDKGSKTVTNCLQSRNSSPGHAKETLLHEEERTISLRAGSPLQRLAICA